MARRSGEFSVCDTLFYFMFIFCVSAFPIVAEILIVSELLKMDWFDPIAWRYACWLAFLIAIQFLHLLYILRMNTQKRLESERRTVERQEAERRTAERQEAECRIYLIDQISYFMPRICEKLTDISVNLLAQENSLSSQLAHLKKLAITKNQVISFCSKFTSIEAEYENLLAEIIDTDQAINILKEGNVEFRRLSESFDSRRLSEIFNVLENFNAEID